MSQVELFKPVDFDRLRVEGNSINEFTQLLKIQFVQDNSAVQVVFDRQHKRNLKLSKPVGYIRFTGSDCVKLAGMFLAAASVLATKTAAGVEAKRKTCQAALNFFSEQVKELADGLAYDILNKLLEAEK